MTRRSAEAPLLPVAGSYRRLFWSIVLGLTLLHALLAASLPLTGDEAYYWDCSRHPDWSYFDQPPLVIWAMIPFRALLGECRLAVRAPAIVASLLLALFLRSLLARLGAGSGETGRRAGLAYLLLHAMPLVFIGSFYASTDIAMATAYTAATWAAVVLATEPESRRAWWVFGVAVGLGFLAKNTAVLVVPALLPCLLRRGVRQALAPAPLLAALAALVLTAPVWIWAAQHHWHNITFQLADRHHGTGFTGRYLGELLAANLLLATPFLVAAMLLGWWLAWRRHDPPWQALLVAAAMPCLVFVLVALHTRVGGHWCGPSLVLGIVPLVLIPFRWRRLLIATGAVTGVVLSAAVLAVAWWPESLVGLDWSYQGRQHRINTTKIAAAIGNEEITAAVAAARLPHELVASESYSTVHLLAFLSRGELPTRLAHVKPGKHGLSSLYWYRPDDLFGADVLFVTEKRQVDGPLAEVFAEVSELPVVEVQRGGQVVRTVRLLRCRDLRRPEGFFSRLSEHDTGGEPALKP